MCAINVILPYSPRKNIAKIMEEYSMLYPATNSASASGRSNGVRFVSAIIAIKKIIARVKSGKTYGSVARCIITIVVKFNEAARRITGKITKLIETS